MAFKKRKDRYFEKHPTGINSLMSGLIDRHGIKKQVTSAMMVRKANDLLKDFLPEHAQEDLRTISFTEDILKVAARHAAAAHTLQDVRQLLEDALARAFPDVQIKNIIHQIHPKSFENFVE